MYVITCITDNEEHVLMDMRDDEYRVDIPVLKLELNGPGSLSFRIFPTHPEFKYVHTLTSIIKVFKVEKNKRKWIFSGRVMTSQYDIRNTGKVECEGILAFLCDSIVRPYEYDGGTPADYIKFLIENHNSQVNKEKQFVIDTLDVFDIDTNNAIYRANSTYPTIYAEMMDKVIKLLDTYVWVRDNDGTLYFDCTQKINFINSQQIIFGENLIDLTKVVEAEELKTVMIGLGAADDEGNKPAVIVENAEAISKFGRIEGLVEFENVGTIEQLTKKTEAYLDSVLGYKNTVEVKAIDLNMTDSEIEEIQLGYAYVYSKPNNINNEMMLISKVELHLMEPANNTFTLGIGRRTITSALSHSSAELDGKINQVAKTTSKVIEYKVTNATQLITGVRGGYVVLDCGEDAKSLPKQILIMDTPDKKTATSVIRMNKNGIGFSTTGYDGPYRNAWTIDGNLVADFVTTGTMLADRIRGGNLEIGGSDLGQNGKITVLDTSNNVLAVIDKNGVDVRKGSVKGATITAGGSSNADGAIYIKDASGTTKITIDCNGINVNNNFKVSMSGQFTAVSIDKTSGAWRQFSDLVDSSDAMSLAKQAISAASSAASQAQSAASAASSAASQAQKTADGLATTVKNINDTIIPDILSTMQGLNGRITTLEGKHK